jgi:2,3-dihydroxybenzoate-AMP ligase
MRPDDEILVVDASDNPVPPGEMGALLTRGPYAPRGYYRAAEHNARAFTPDGWYRTGDVVRLHPSGNLVVEGRDKDLINRGGEKISAEEVENLIYRLPGVARVASVAKADPDLGERVCAMVVVEPGAHLSLESVRAALTAMQVARYKLPEDLLVVDELPLTKVGKIDKKVLIPLRRCPRQRTSGTGAGRRRCRQGSAPGAMRTRACRVPRGGARWISRPRRW